MRLTPGGVAVRSIEPAKRGWGRVLAITRGLRHAAHTRGSRHTAITRGLRHAAHRLLLCPGDFAKRPRALGSGIGIRT